ncbi:crotonase/enoyl-CoA hydratase family protein [Mycolicibacterium cosmeticum]|uniref:crotonase/enoyl-CoA hydratase family protein n=1 Tax=Mycolicibacterium cosmeticum TaxID=258533 RepID=UPI003204E634
MTHATYLTLNVRREGTVLVIGLNRPDKHNAFNRAMINELATVLGMLDRDPGLRAGVLYGEGRSFTSGLDLPDVVPSLQKGSLQIPDGGINPWQVDGQRLTKPLVAAVHGKCLTLGIELALAADVVVCTVDATFAQLEIARGIYPFGGATLRFPAVAGWGNAMRWMLTAEEFDAAEAFRIGIVQEIVPEDTHVQRAVELAQVIAAQAPLGVQATLHSARLARRESEAAAEAELVPTVVQLFGTEDARIGMESFFTRRTAQFVGR